MTRKIYQFAMAGLLLSAAQIVAAPSARAEVINLVCKGKIAFRGEYFTDYLWIDPDKKTVIHGHLESDGTITYTQHPVEINATTYTWPTTPGWTETVDRNTGHLESHGGTGIPQPQYDPYCEKGTMPPPAPKL